jgi:integrase
VKPLSDAAIAVLDAAAALSDASSTFVFPSPGDPERPLDERRPTRALARLCERLELPHGSPHDFRRSGATALTGQYGFSGYIVGLVLGHQVVEGARVTGVYDRYDRLKEKRAALDAWAGHVGAIAEGRELTNVVAFPQSVAAS